MQWFEPLIAIGAVLIVVLPIVLFFYKKKKGTLKCECGHYMKDCVGDCKSCAAAKKDILEKCKKELDAEMNK